MLTYRSLENLSTETILDTFNLAFSDYFIPLKLTSEQFEGKLQAENINPAYSVGAFDGEHLVGFILHGYDELDGKKMLYNGGTGVIPSHRGKGITKEMYRFVLSFLKAKQIKEVLLEVIEQNEQAIKSYKAVGFEHVRSFNCYSGDIVLPDNFTSSIKKIPEINWDEWKTHWDIQPTWQHSIATAKRYGSKVLYLGIYDEDKIAGYVVYNPTYKRLLQLCIKREYRRKGMAKQMLYSIAKDYGTKFSVINVENTYEPTSSLFPSVGLNKSLNQFDYKLTL